MVQPVAIISNLTPNLTILHFACFICNDNCLYLVQVVKKAYMCINSEAYTCEKFCLTGQRHSSKLILSTSSILILLLFFFKIFVVVPLSYYTLSLELTVSSLRSLFKYSNNVWRKFPKLMLD